MGILNMMKRPFNMCTVPAPFSHTHPQAECALCILSMTKRFIGSMCLLFDASFHAPTHHPQAECAPRIQYGQELCTEEGARQLASKLQPYK